MARAGFPRLHAVGMKTRVDGNRVKSYLSKCLRALQPKSVKTLTPPAVAKMLGVNPDKVLSWIRKGELHATNVTAKPGGRPRYRIEKEDLDAFRNRRIPKAKVKPKRVKPSGKTYF
jgi:excisionase family DNA binding protein